MRGYLRGRQPDVVTYFSRLRPRFFKTPLQGPPIVSLPLSLEGRNSPPPWGGRTLLHRLARSSDRVTDVLPGSALRSSNVQRLLLDRGKVFLEYRNALQHFNRVGIWVLAKSLPVVPRGTHQFHCQTLLFGVSRTIDRRLALPSWHMLAQALGAHRAGELGHRGVARLIEDRFRRNRRWFLARPDGPRSGCTREVQNDWGSIPKRSLVPSP